MFLLVIEVSLPFVIVLCDNTLDTQGESDWPGACATMLAHDSVQCLSHGCLSSILDLLTDCIRRHVAECIHLSSLEHVHTV